MSTALLAAAIAGCAAGPDPQIPPESVRAAATRAPDWATQVAGLERRPGLFDLYVDRARGRLLALLPPATGARGEIAEVLYVEGILTGLGSNPVGLDRGQIGESAVVVFRRVGARVLLERPNLRFRALSDDPAETAAVRESFATSVIWAADVLGEDAAGRQLVDLTSFVVRDAHGVATRLARTGQGSYVLDRERSAIDFDASLAFPRNLELEAVLTFAGAQPGEEMHAVAPDPAAVTLVVHHSLLELPGPGYRPREHDPRMGSFAIEFADYAAGLERAIERRWIVRHRLEKVDPAAPRSPVREPIVYYVDRGAPEPIRSALVEGASWWADAFAAAGFEDAFRVDLLPEGAHPLDARYNVIQWVHRATRGWSYGGGVIDPRTGEMIKGHVSLGSLRIRQDRLLFEGLAGTEKTGSGEPDDPIVLALARIRQLSAHEVGHTLGIGHNFAASTYGRASVMDYPAPLVQVTADGRLDFSEAYAVGVGDWDLAAIRWAYAEFPPGADEATELDAIARDTIERGMIYLSEGDARSPTTGHPLASLWDNGSDPVAALAQTMRVRRIAMTRFGEANLAAGRPLAALEEVFAPVYFHHRFQLAAAAKALGGLDYRHALRGDGQPSARPVAAERQRRALSALLETLTPAALDIPESTLRLLVPRPPEMERSREQFARRTGPAFDALGAAATAADLTLRALLEPARAARLIDFHRRNPALPDFSEVLAATVDRVFPEAPPSVAREGEVLRVVQRVLVERLLALSIDADAAPWVRQRVDGTLAELLQRIDAQEPPGAAAKAHLGGLTAEIGRHLARPAAASEPSRAALTEPPGEPIGAAWDPDPNGECGFAERP
jgi:hypothetical protein